MDRNWWVIEFLRKEDFKCLESEEVSVRRNMVLGAALCFDVDRGWCHLTRTDITVGVKLEGEVLNFV